MLTSGTDPISLGIKFAIRGPWSHSQLVLEWPWVISADPFKVYIRRVKDAESEKYAIRRYPGLTADQALKILNYAKALEGQKFDVLGMILFGTGMDAKDAWWCSEVVYSCYSQGAGIELLSNVTPAMVQPNYLWITPSLENVFVKK